MRTVFRRLLSPLRRARDEADLRDEIAAHQALRQSALERDGLSPAAAAAASRRAMGNVTLAAEDARDVWALRMIDNASQDLRAAVRGLRKSPTFALVAIATFAIGIGANTALFSIYNGLILRPLPVREPSRLVLVDADAWTYPIWKEIERHGAGLFDGTFAWSAESFDLAQGGQTDPVPGAFVSGSLLPGLGIVPVVGRVIGPTDDQVAGTTAVAVISHRLWERRFGGATSVVGRQLTLDRQAFTIVGVLPANFLGPDVGEMLDVMIPFAAEPILRGSDSMLNEHAAWWLNVMARLKRGQTIEDANAALRAVQPLVRAATMPDWPAQMQARYLTEPLTLVGAATGRSPLRGRFATPLLAMVVAVGLVLLVACASIASVLLARAIARRRELSVRLALGASRPRLARMLLTESLVIAATGGAGGLLFAQWSSTLLVAQLDTWRGRVNLDLSLDWRVLAFTATLTSACALAASLTSLLGITRVGAGEALKDGGRGLAGDRRLAVRSVLVATQLALSLVLIVSAGLFLHTFVSLSRLPLGFNPGSLVVAQLNAEGASAAPDQRGDLFERLRTAALAVPGVTAAGVSHITPISGRGWNSIVGDAEPTPANQEFMTWLNAATPGWFRAMGMPLRQGRDFDTSDRAPDSRSVVVNETFANRFLANDRPAVGQSVQIGGQASPYDVIGVVADAAYRNPREGVLPTLYLPLKSNETWSDASLTIATPGNRVGLEQSIVDALTNVDPGVTVTFQTFDGLVDATVTQERLVAQLSTFFGALSLLLAAIGVYGVVAQGVSARRTEIGVRLALGASPQGIVRLVLGRVALLIAAGLAFGAAGSFWATDYVSALLFGTEARDLATFAGAAAVLASVGLLAAWWPARAASRTDPAVVLREGQTLT